MKEPFERIDDVEIVELSELLKRIREKGAANDADKIFIAGLMGMRRLVVSQHNASQELMKGQDRSHREMLDEQRSLVRWQKVSTFSTAAMVLLTGFYVYETHSMVAENRKMASAAQEQLEIAKQQLREAGRPLIHLDLDSPEFTISGDTLKSRGAADLRFFVSNKSLPAAYNLRCGIRLFRAGTTIDTKYAQCGRDALFRDYSESFEFSLTRAQLISLSSNKPKTASIEAFVTYSDSPKAGNRYTVTRKAHLEEIKDDAISVKALQFETRQIPRETSN